MQTAKIFRHDGSQAVRLPTEFRFDVGEVFVWRDDDRSPCLGDECDLDHA